jgi:xyloglucan-specific exo-beta-1,4-glucanase
MLRQILFLLIILGSCTGLSQAQRFATKKQKWRHLGPHTVPTPMGKIGSPSAHGLGLIQSLYISKTNPLYILAGSNSGGIYKTIDGGKNWKSLNNFGLVTGVLDIEVDPVNPNEIWIATGTVVNKEVFGHGLLHSTDGGESWQKTGLDFVPLQYKVVWQVARSQSEPNIFYACTSNEVYRSTDRAKNWVKIYEGRKGLDFRDLIVHPKNANYVVASGEEVFISKYAGETWTMASATLQYKKINSSRPPNRIAVNTLPGVDSGLIVLYSAGNKNYIETSKDWGSTWQLKSINRTFSRVDKANAEIAVPPGSPNTIFVGCVRTYKSTNDGARFKQITFPLKGHQSFVHDDIREMVLVDSNTVYVGCDGGVSNTTDGGKSWTDISGKGLSVTQIYGLGQPGKDKYPVIVGCQDLSSIIIYKDSVKSTGHIYGDGGRCIIDKKGNWYIMQNGWPRYSDDRGKTWKHLKIRFYPNSYDYPILLDPSDDSSFYMADHYLYHSDLSGNLVNISLDVTKTSNKIREMDINQSEPRSIVFAKDEPTWGQGNLLKNKLYRSTLSPDTFLWEDITPSLGLLAWKSVSGITSNNKNKNELWITLYGSAGKDGVFTVFRSGDRGTSWTDFSEGLSFYNTYAIEYIDNSRSGLFLACDNGVYFRNNRTKKWIRLRGKMPQIMVKSMAINYKKRRLRVGTYGNGVWEMKIPRRMLK